MGRTIRRECLLEGRSGRAKRGTVALIDTPLWGTSAQSLLKQDYKDELTLDEAKALALKVMSKTMDSTKLGSEKRALRLSSAAAGLALAASLRADATPPPPPAPTVEFATMTLDPTTQAPTAKIYRAAELDALLRQHDVGGKSEDSLGVGEGTGGGGGGDVSVST